jgi:hypothetical protein
MMNARPWSLFLLVALSGGVNLPAGEVDIFSGSLPRTWPRTPG